MDRTGRQFAENGLNGRARDKMIIQTIEELEAAYGVVSPAARLKVLDHVSLDYGKFIEASPFFVMATVGPEGVDCSPRGDPRGFVRIGEDRKTLFIPDRRGNNRLDSLRNIVRDPRVQLIFFVPGVGETLRVNGSAQVNADMQLRESFTMQDKVPTTVIVVQVQQVYTQCQKALVRSKLWDPEMHIARSALPTVGQMLNRITEGEFDGEKYDRDYPERMKQTIY
jgi:uncharacterized protein